MFPLLLLTALLYSDRSNTLSYPLHVTGSQSAVHKLIHTLNSEMEQPLESLHIQQLNSNPEEYGILLTQRMENGNMAIRENRFRYILNCLLTDSRKTIRVHLVENDPRILISDGKKSIIDIADVEKFNSIIDRDFTAFNVLLHELYEQYQLQVVEKLRHGNVSDAQLKKAHLKAVQKESNLYGLTMLRTKADIIDDYMDIEFSSRINSCKRRYYVYFIRGNVDRVEKISDDCPAELQ